MDHAFRHRWVLVAEADLALAVTIPAGVALVTPATAPDAAAHLARLSTRAVLLRPDRHTLGSAETPAELSALLAAALPNPVDLQEPEMVTP